MPAVLLFKSESDGPEKFTSLLKANNFDVHSIACLKFEFKNIELLLEKLSKSDDYEGIIFTSPRTVQGVHKSTEMQADVLDGWKMKTNYSVGETTGRLVHSLLNLHSKGSQSGNAQRLASHIISDYSNGPSKPFLFPAGNLKQEILQNLLAKEAIEVDCLEVYETIPHSELRNSIERFKNIKIDFVVFFSPSGILFTLPFLKEHNYDLAHLKIIAIGPSTKRCLEESELKCFGMCKTPTPESLLELFLDQSAE